MKTTIDFLFYATILSIILIVIDIAFLRLRKKIAIKGLPLVSPFLDGIRRVEKRLSRFKENIRRIDPSEEVTYAGQPEISSEELSIPANDVLSMDKSSIRFVQSGSQQVTFDQIPTTAVETRLTGKTIQFQITADVPEGMIVHITIDGSKGIDKTTVSQTVLDPKIVGQDYKHPETSTRELAAGNSQKKQADKVWPDIQKKILTLPRVLRTGSINWNLILFLASVVIYMLVVTIGIDRFPIYFFTDEAVHANLASEFVGRGFTDSTGAILPTYFSLGPSFGLNGVSVYLQVIPYIIFGKSIIATRMVSALVTLLAAILVGLLLKQVFKIRSYWLGILLLITSPAWFLHARTAFEYMEVASFYAALLYFYNRYRQGQDQYLYAAILAGALTFYTHGLGQILAGLTGLMFFISDFRYHFQKERRETMYIAMGLVILCILPYLRYNLDNFDTIPAQIRQRGSYWMDGNFTLTKKIAKFFEQYSLGINPLFWFFPNSIDIVRHKMLGYGNIHLFLLPFAIAGMVKSVINFRKPEYRTILITFFVSPIPATVVAIGTPRVLWMIIPWVILIALGFNWFAVWISTRKPIIKFSIINWAVFITLALTSGFMLRDAIVNGPLWFKDYGLYGMQYGAKQVFQDTVARELKNNPNIKFIISPSWANGTDQFASFFVPPDLLKRVQFGTPNDLYNNPTWLTPGSIFIITTDEFSNFSKDARFKNLQVQETIPFPDGKPGFYLVTLKFADNIDEIMAAEHEARRKPVEGHVMINGQTTRILHSPIGGGNIQDSFDDNPDTLTRVVEANPYVFELNPSTPIVTHSITIQTGSLSDFTVTISLYAPGSSVPEIYTQTFQDLPPDPLVIVEFDNGPASSERIYIEIKDNTSGETSQIHVRTIAFK